MTQSGSVGGLAAEHHRLGRKRAGEPVPVPLAWSLGAAPPDPARGVDGDYGMLVAALITVGLIIWRDHASSAAWQSVTAWLLFALMIAWSGQENVLMGLAVVLVAVILAQAIGHRRPSHGRPVGSPGRPS